MMYKCKAHSALNMLLDGRTYSSPMALFIHFFLHRLTSASVLDRFGVVRSVLLYKGGESMDGRKVGRPLMYETAEEIQEKIDEYFEECKGELLTDDDGNIARDKYGIPIYINQKPLTITGLALALGFNSRQALLNYQGRDEFNDTITRAKARIEQYAEERLFDKDGANGAKFSLANNFEGWKEKQSIEADVSNSVTINIELSDDE